MKYNLSCVLCFWLIASAFNVRAELVVIDDFQSLDAWKVITADGVTASIHADTGPDGPALRLDYNFERGAGYCIIQRKVDLALPENYRFTVGLRGDGPPNNLEFKLLDPSMENVWWVNQRAFEWPKDWQTLKFKARKFTFAWGPSGGKRLERLGAIEFAVASANGGKGSVWFDRLTFEELPAVQAVTPPPVATFSSNPPKGAESGLTLDETGRVDWQAAEDDPAPSVTLDFGGVREIGGLAIDSRIGVTAGLGVESSNDGKNWEFCAAPGQSEDWDAEGESGVFAMPYRGGKYLRFKEFEARFIRVSGHNTFVPHVPRGPAPIPRIRIRSIRVLPIEFGESDNFAFKIIASESRRGLYPRYFLGEQAYWTVVGAPGASEEALFDSDGAIELRKLGARMEPSVWVWGGDDPNLNPLEHRKGKLTSWADCDATLMLSDGYLPIPTVSWKTPLGLKLEITPLALAGTHDPPLLARYRLTNGSQYRRFGELVLAIRPFQVLPPWQELNITGGMAKVGRIERRGNKLVLNHQTSIAFEPRPERFETGTAYWGAGMLVSPLRDLENPMSDPEQLALAEVAYSFDLEPGASRTFIVSVARAQTGGTTREGIPAETGARDDSRTSGERVTEHADATADGMEPGASGEDRSLAGSTPHRPLAGATPDESGTAGSGVSAEQQFDSAYERVADWWAQTLNRVQLKLPPAAAKLAATFKTQQAYILINADGPAIQPGSRNYERSWIRDGALTSTALLYTGHPEQAKAFLEWYAPFQFENGKVPCVVDRRGPDPVNEHDSTGELIYALLKYYQFTGDREFLERHFKYVVKGVEYIDALRHERMTPEYRDGPPEQRAKYGLVPESISHEGYSAKPMHSYWDSFWTLRGLKDAVTIAEILAATEDTENTEELQGKNKTGRADGAAGGGAPSAVDRELPATAPLRPREGAGRDGAQGAGRYVAEWAKIRDEYRKALYESIDLAMKNKGINFIPGCVELGDFDATSTAIALYPCGEADNLPEPARTNTFDKYYKFFCDRRDGKIEWEAYTPYEVRLIGTFVRLGQPERAHELADYFFKDQRPSGWNQWAEVVFRDPKHPGFIGDMPHTWVGSDFISAVRSMFVYERDSDHSLIVAAGVKPEWLLAPEGVSIRGFPTEYGLLTYTLSGTAKELIFEYELDQKPSSISDFRFPIAAGSQAGPPGGIVLKLPKGRKVLSVAPTGTEARLKPGEVVLSGRQGRVVVGFGN